VSHVASLHTDAGTVCCLIMCTRAARARPSVCYRYADEMVAKRRGGTLGSREQTPRKLPDDVDDDDDDNNTNMVKRRAQSIL
jgi:hypothetical protein